MTNRELLELAAKAIYRGMASQMIDSGWNPLTDDGDCARMEAAIDAWISWDKDFVTVMGKVEHFKDHNGDKNAARRYASTRAAAQIGKETNRG